MAVSSSPLPKKPTVFLPHSLPPPLLFPFRFFKWCPSAFFISAFGIRIKLSVPETMERLGSNLSHIFGSRGEMLIKVFFTEDWGYWGKWGRTVPYPTGWPLFPPQKKPFYFQVHESIHYKQHLPLPEAAQCWEVPLCSWEKVPSSGDKVHFPKNQLQYFILSNDQFPTSLLQKDLPTQHDILQSDTSNPVDISL